MPHPPHAPPAPAPNDSQSKIHQLLQSLLQEFDALQQYHESIIKQNDFFKQTANSEVDIDKAYDLQLLTERDTSRQTGGSEVDFDNIVDGIQIDIKASASAVAASRKFIAELGEPVAQREDAFEAVDADDNNPEDLFLRCVSGGFSGGPEVDVLQQLDEQEIKDVEAALNDVFGDTEPHRRPRLSRSESSLSDESGMVTAESLRQFSRKFHGGSYTSEGSILSGSLIKRPLKTMKVLFKSPWFEITFALVIITNAAVMCAEFQFRGIQLGHDLQYRGLTGTEPRRLDDVWTVLDWAFGIIFCLELLFKFAVLFHGFFRDLWNWLDLVAVLIFVLEKILGSSFPTGLQCIRLVRLIRLGRLLKLVRTVEGFDSLYLMTTALKGSLTVLAWALVLLFAIQMPIGLVVGEVLRSTYFEDTASPVETQHKIYEYFGTWTRSLLSMFEMTLANWPPVCRLLSEEVSEWFVLLCLVHKLTIGFAVIGVINGVFMQETLKVAATDDVLMVRQKSKAERLHRENMRELFDALDSSGDGHVSLREFRLLSQFPVVRTWLASMDFHIEDLETMFHLIDIDHDGKITFEELMSGMAKLKGSARSIDLLVMMKHHQVPTFPPTQ